MKIRII